MLDCFCGDMNISMPFEVSQLLCTISLTWQVGHTFTFVTRGDLDRFEKMLRESADCWERIRPLAMNSVDPGANSL